MALPRLSAQQPIVTRELTPSSPFLQFMEALRTMQESIDTRQDELLAALSVQIARLTGQTIATSFADGLTLSAEADGATAKAIISSHTRTYTDASVSVTGATVTGLDYGEAYSIYYDDADRAGGAVTYVATLDPTIAVTSDAHPSRHLVGVVSTPATSGDPPTTGGGTRPPGFPPGGLYVEP